LTGPLLIFLGLVALNKDDYPRTTALLEEGLRLLREIGDPYGTAICCGTLGFVALHQDDVDRADAWFEEALRPSSTPSKSRSLPKRSSPSTPTLRTLAPARWRS
jgi:hypothetical protein